jgi:hypothetical protein
MGTAPSFTAGQVVTAAQLAFLADPPRAHAVQGAAQSIPNSTLTALAFGTEVEDNDVMFTPGDAFMTVKTAGRFIVSASASFAASGTGIRVMLIRKNASELVRDGKTGAVYATCSATTVARFAVNDTISVWVQQTSGGALNTDVTIPVFLTAQWVGK